MIKKVVKQIHITSNNDFGKLELAVNKFCLEHDVIDIKYQNGGWFTNSTCVIVYSEVIEV